MQEWLAGALADEPRTVVLVTHDVEEALYLCDRVLVLSRAARDACGPSSRWRCRRAAAAPRDRHLAEFTALRERALEALRMRHAAGRRRSLLLALADRRLGGCSRGSAGSRTTCCRRPSEVAQALVEDRDLLLPDAWVTAQEVLLGFALALARRASRSPSLLHLSPVLRRAVYPLVVASQAVPVIVIAPILVIWFGFGMAPKLIVIALICFFPIVVNTLDGLRVGRPRPGEDAAHAGRLALRTSSAAWSCPSALPYLFSGAKVAVAVAVIGAVFGELVGSDAGLGHAIQVGTAQLLTARVFAAVLILSVMAIALFALVAAARAPGGAVGRQAERAADVSAGVAGRRCVAGCARRAGARRAAARSPSPSTGSVAAARARPRARLVPEPRPRRDLRGARRRATSATSGLDVQPHVPSDPAAPIKQVAAGRADLAISYEPEVLAGARAGPAGGGGRGARAAPAHLADGDRRSPASARCATCAASASAPPASRTSRPT